MLCTSNRGKPLNTMFNVPPEIFCNAINICTVDIKHTKLCPQLRVKCLKINNLLFFCAIFGVKYEMVNAI